jgi:hypothetical protein
VNLQNIDRLKQLLARVETNARQPRTRTEGLAAFVAAPAASAAQVTPAAPSAPAPTVAASAAQVTPVAPNAPAAAAPAASSPVNAPPIAPAAIPGIAPLKVEPVVVSRAAEPAIQPPPAAAVSAPPVSLSPDDVEVDLVEDMPLEDVSLEDIAAVEIDELSVEASSDVAGEIVDDVASGDLIEAASAPIAPPVISEPAPSGWNDRDLASVARPAPDAKAPAASTYTAPPSLDELTFSEPPPPQPLEEIEPPPISAAQPVSEAPGSIDAALLAASEAQTHGASESVEPAELEGPTVTPPPESGPQVAVPALGAPNLPSDMAADAAPYRQHAPTVEQLGDVIELDQASGPPLELAARSLEPQREAPAPSSAPEELEYVPRRSVPSLPLESREPMQTLVGGFTEDEAASSPIDTPPPQARIVVPSAIEVMPEERGTTPIQSAMPGLGLPLPPQGSFGDEAPTAASSVLVPDVTERTPVVAAPPVVNVIASARAFKPASFLELLDASLSLLK